MGLEIGLQGRREMVVLKEHLASFTGNLNADVLSTHRVVLLMELSARDAIKNMIPKGKITLGTRIDIRHLAAAPLGAKVHAEARLKAIQGNRLCFHVAVYNGLEKLAEGENEQIVVSLERFKSRFEKKGT
jgi:fluoroacetyl-CoA thioesterase